MSLTEEKSWKAKELVSGNHKTVIHITFSSNLNVSATIKRYLHLAFLMSEVLIFVSFFMDH